MAWRIELQESQDNRQQRNQSADELKIRFSASFFLAVVFNVSRSFRSKIPVILLITCLVGSGLGRELVCARVYELVLFRGVTMSPLALDEHWAKMGECNLVSEFGIGGCGNATLRKHGNLETTQRQMTERKCGSF